MTDPGDGETARSTAAKAAVFDAVSTNAEGRIVGYDLARSLAILGMVVVHFCLVLAKDPHGANWFQPVLSFLDGRVSAIFVVVAGIGCTLLSRNAVARADHLRMARLRTTLVKRGLFLLLIGLANLVIWPGDILRVYGISFCIAAWLLNASSRTLWIFIVAFAVGFIVLCGLFEFDKNWDWETLAYRHLWTAEGMMRNLFFDGFRSVFPWAGFFLLGMWLGRFDLRQPAINLRVMTVGLNLAVAAEWISYASLAYLLPSQSEETREITISLLGTRSMPAFPLFLLASGGTAIAMIALCVRIAEWSWARAWLFPLIATGQLALTWYVAHILLGLGGIVAFDQAGRYSVPFAAACGLLFYLLTMALSVFWKRRFHYGPLEMLLRIVAG